MNYSQKQEIVAKYLLNKMLKKYNVDVDYILEHQQIDGKDWYMHYTWTEAEQTKFLEEGVEYVKKTLRVPTQRAKSIMGMFLLQWGFKIDNNNKQENNG